MLQQLKEETGIRATHNPLISDYGRKLSELEKAQELFNLAQQEGTAAGKELTSATQLLSGDLSALTPEARAQAEAMRALATQYGITAAAAEQLKTSQEAAAKSSTESLELAKSVTGGILSDIRSALSDGKITWKEWGEIAVNALNKVADKLQEMLLNQLFSPTGGAGGFLGLLTGGAGFTPTTTLGGFLGAFNKGGYTGDGGKNQPAGIVHKGEYVFDADSVQRLGIRNLQALQGYANGGLVGGMPRLPNVAGAGGQEVHVYVDDEGGLRAYVQREGRKTEARIATTTRGTFDNYRKNDLHNDINNHTRNSRRRG
jgi:lambda family phage tail tape measure protein